MHVNGNGKPVFPVHWGIRCFMQAYQQREQQSGSNKDPSAALGMTIREEGQSYSAFKRIISVGQSRREE